MCENILSRDYDKQGKTEVSDPDLDANSDLESARREQMRNMSKTKVEETLWDFFTEGAVQLPMALKILLSCLWKA